MYFYDVVYKRRLKKWHFQIVEKFAFFIFPKGLTHDFSQKFEISLESDFL